MEPPLTDLSGSSHEIDSVKPVCKAAVIIQNPVDLS